MNLYRTCVVSNHIASHYSRTLGKTLCKSLNFILYLLLGEIELPSLLWRKLEHELTIQAELILHVDRDRFTYLLANHHLYYCMGWSVIW